MIRGTDHLGYEGNANEPSLLPQQSDQFIIPVQWCIHQSFNANVRVDDRLSAGLNDISAGLLRSMSKINDDSQPVHLSHQFTSEWG